MECSPLVRRVFGISMNHFTAVVVFGADAEGTVFQEPESIFHLSTLVPEPPSSLHVPCNENLSETRLLSFIVSPLERLIPLITGGVTSFLRLTNSSTLVARPATSVAVTVSFPSAGSENFALHPFILYFALISPMECQVAFVKEVSSERLETVYLISAGETVVPSILKPTDAMPPSSEQVPYR